MLGGCCLILPQLALRLAESVWSRPRASGAAGCARAVALLAGVALHLLCYPVLAAAEIGQSAARLACSALGAPPGVQLTETPAWIEGTELPTYCRVRGTIEGRTEFEMRLPARWSGRFVMAGCGGFCGALLPDKPGHSNAIGEAVKRGYAAISHDGGHKAKSWETHWAADPVALELWAHRILPVVANTGSALATALYGRAPDYRYFSGCSNGGRLGLQAAQRYPGLFDGIAAGGSIFELSGIAGLWGNWLITTNQSGANSRIAQARVPLIKQLVMASCDALDGIADGIIDDPRSCQVDFRQAACGAASLQQEQCLTTEEAELLNTLYGGVRNGEGEPVYPAVAYGSEHYADHWLFGAEGEPAWGVKASAGYRQLLARDLGLEDVPAGLTTDQMLEWISRSAIPGLTDANNADLSGLRRSGHKLLIYQGWSDPLIIPEPITHYYQEASRAAGGLEQLQAYARLFMVPGWGHCWERPADAPDQFDPLLELERWVERGQAPEFIVTRQQGVAGKPARSRPMCSFPAVARLQAGKNPDQYESYDCVDGSPVAAR